MTIIYWKATRINISDSAYMNMYKYSVSCYHSQVGFVEVNGHYMSVKIIIVYLLTYYIIIYMYIFSFQGYTVISFAGKQVRNAKYSIMLWFIMMHVQCMYQYEAARAEYTFNIQLCKTCTPVHVGCSMWNLKLPGSNPPYCHWLDYLFSLVPSSILHHATCTSACKFPTGLHPSVGFYQVYVQFMMCLFINFHYCLHL